MSASHHFTVRLWRSDHETYGYTEIYHQDVWEGSNVHWSNLTYNKWYKVTEDTESGYTLNSISSPQYLNRDDDDTFNVVNWQQARTGSITINKHIEDRDLRGIAFNFTLSSTGQTDRTASITITGSGNYDGSTTVNNLPFGTWTITEATGAYICTNPSDYDTQTTLDSSHTSRSVSFTNDEIRTGSITINKHIEDKDLRGILFNFTLSSTGQTNRTASIMITGSGNYDGSITVSGLPYGTWTITEATGDYICTSPSDYDR
jgi:hypothetical protein